MDTLSSKFSTVVKGVITGFDRIVFKGIVMPIMHAAGMESFLAARKVLNKDFKEYSMKRSQEIIESAEKLAEEQCGSKIDYIRSVNERKEALARERQNESGVKEGLIGVWSCVESCNTFRSTYNPKQKYPSLRNECAKCKHLYYYFDDPVYGFMNVRLQTWLPYEIQIALNGREWLRRSLDAAGCGYLLSGNKFLHIDDYGLAQEILDAQAKTDFKDVLNGFLPIVFPRMREILGPGLSYYWTFWQSEMAKDYIFGDSEALNALMDDFLLHALVTGKGGQILQYFGSPVKANGQPHHSAKPEIMSKAKLWYDGTRVRHWQDKNSVKFYNEHNVLRFEMTMNDPTRFKIHRHSETQKKTEPKKFIPMRKGVADTYARAEVSKSILNRFTEHMSAAEEKERLGKMLELVCSPLTRQGKRFRALEVFGKDKELLRAIADPAFDAGAITNKGLQKTLKGTAWAKNMSGKQLSARISRHLRLLREHGLIKKLPKQRKYTLTDKGRKITAALEAALSASVNDLLKLAV
jgi:DNA-binding HxlR family transcriptional regulator